MIKCHWLVAVSVIFGGSRSNLVEAGSPSVYGGGCHITKGKLYYVGGALDKFGTSLNNKTFSLDLRKPFKIDNAGEAPWMQESIEDADTPVANFPVVFSPNDKPGYLMMIGGDGVDPLSSVQLLDTDYGSWSTLRYSGKSWVGITNSTRNATNYSLSKAAIVQSDVEPSKYLLYGGVFYKGGERMATNSSMVWQYDADTGMFSNFNDFKVNIHGHTTFVYDSIMYALGGSDPNTNVIYNMNVLPYMDLRNGKVGTVNLLGESPQIRVGHSSVLVDNKVYVMGGSKDPDITNYFPDQYHVLNIDTLTWSSVKLPGLDLSYMGCLAHYNGILINAFGYKDNSPQSKTYLIEIKSNSLLGRYSEHLTEINSSDIGDILGSIFGCFSFVFIVLIFAYCLRIRKRKESEGKPIV